MSKKSSNPPSFSEQLARFPWEKTFTWGVFLWLVYVLRDFFPLIFLTFIFSYIAGNVVRKIISVVPFEVSSLVYKILTVVVFLIFLLLLYGLVAFLRKPFEEQLKSLRFALRGQNPQALVDDLLHETVGSWRFEDVYEGGEKDKTFEKDFAEFLSTHPQQKASGEISEEARREKLKSEFISHRKNELTQEALTEWEFVEVENIKQKVGELFPRLIGFLGQVGVYVFQSTIWFALALLISFFITLDLPRIKRGLRRLESSRVRHLYLEIAPSVIAFGGIIGRAFQAQAVIAVCNTVLTFGLIKALDIQYELFLCTIVFICSFIPVLGVIFSTVPIALIGLLSHGLGTALMAILGVMLVHFIETSILNPKILGDMLHVHPVLVLTVLVIGEHFFGVWGLLLGVPVLVYVLRYVILGELMDESVCRET